jgi:hypothetical protein
MIEHKKWCILARGIKAKRPKTRAILHKIKRRNAHWNGHILHTNWILNHISEVKTEGRKKVIGSRVERRKQILDDLKETIS